MMRHRHIWTGGRCAACGITYGQNAAMWRLVNAIVRYQREEAEGS